MEQKQFRYRQGLAGSSPVINFAPVLVLPPTIQVPIAEDLPDREDIAVALAKRDGANITQGYHIIPNKTKQLPFVFIAEININNDKLWDLFTVLAGDLPAELCCIFGLYDDEEPVTTGYHPKNEILQTLEKCKTELCMDASIEFGLLHQSRTLLAEIFVSSAKYIRYWGSDKEAFIQHMLAFGLGEIPVLAFVDEYPKLVLPLRNFVAGAKHPETVKRILGNAFGTNG